MYSTAGSLRIEHSRLLLLEWRSEYRDLPPERILPGVEFELRCLSDVAAIHPETAATLIPLVIEWVKFRELVKTRLN